MKLKALFATWMIFVLLFCPNIVFAADVPLKWPVAQGATGYKIQMSEDMGATWQNEIDVGNVTSYLWTGAPDAGLLLFRAVSYNAAGQAIRTYSGSWFDGSKKLPSDTGSLGVE